MSRLTVRLPESLHEELVKIATKEGVSLNQYVVYALTRQSSLREDFRETSKLEIQQQEESFQAVRQKLGRASREEVEAIMAQREVADGDAQMSSDVIDRLQEKIRARQQ